MFDKLKQLNKLREIKSALEKEKKEVEKEGVKVVVSGSMEVEEVVLNSQLAAEEQARLVKECLNQALKEIQQEAAKRMFQS